MTGADTKAVAWTKLEQHDINLNEWVKVSIVREPGSTHRRFRLGGKTGRSVLVCLKGSGT
jgi:hypothetical protein